MWCSQFSVHHCSCVRTQSSPTSFQVTTAIPRTFHYFLKTYSACQDFTLPDKFSHCLKTIEILCPTAIGYKAAGQWGLSSCFIVTVFMRIFFSSHYSSHWKMLSPLSWNDCQIQCGLTKLLSWKKKSQDYIHKAERKTATFYSFIKDVGVLGLISLSAWGNLNQHHLSLRRTPEGCAVLHTKVCLFSLSAIGVSWSARSF